MTDAGGDFATVSTFLGKAPVDLEGMAHALGLQVKVNDTLESNISGSLNRKQNLAGQPCYSIELNGAHSERRRRFTLAHEIAHYLLHRDLMADDVVDDKFYRSELSDPLEWEANKYAADLLMPANLVTFFWQAGVKDLKILCKIFNASEKAVEIRLRQLKLTV